MPRIYSSKYVVAGLGTVILAGLSVWLIKSEGERTRRMLRDSRRDAARTPSVVPQPSPDQDTRPADTKPIAAELAARAEEDFSLDDHLVFPGLADEVSKTRAKPRADPAAGDGKINAKTVNRAGSD
jgi:hypothetical protein